MKCFEQFTVCLRNNQLRVQYTLGLFFCYTLALGQNTKTTQQVEQTWTGYFNQTRLSDKWGFWTDIHFRTKEEWVQDAGQFIFRVGGTYYLNDKTKLTAGYAFINHFPAESHQNISQPEHRPWQQVQWHANSSRFKLMQWVRLEERFRRKIESNDALADGYNFNWRVRYNIMMQFPLGKKPFAPGSLALAVNDEAMINFGKEITYNYFDQNRFFVGFHLYTSTHNWLQFGYMNLFQQLAAGNKYRTIHAARIFYFQNLDLRKDKKH
jgi:Protein of unknown function (DUF2490)